MEREYDVTLPFKIEPEGEIKFTKKSNGYFSSEIRILNTSLMKILVKIKTTAAESYNVKPNIFIVDCGNSKDVMITLIPSQEFGRHEKDRFLIECQKIPNNETVEPQALPTIWKSFLQKPYQLKLNVNYQNMNLNPNNNQQAIGGSFPPPLVPITSSITTTTAITTNNATPIANNVNNHANAMNNVNGMNPGNNNNNMEVSSPNKGRNGILIGANNNNNLLPASFSSPIPNNDGLYSQMRTPQNMNFPYTSQQTPQTGAISYQNNFEDSKLYGSVQNFNQDRNYINSKNQSVVGLENSTDQSSRQDLKSEYETMLSRVEEQEKILVRLGTERDKYQKELDFLTENMYKSKITTTPSLQEHGGFQFIHVIIVAIASFLIGAYLSK